MEVESLREEIKSAIKNAKKKEKEENKDVNAYDFCHEYRGLAIVISNGKFKRSSERPYYRLEIDNMRKLFETLQFTTVCFPDLTAEQIECVLDEVSIQNDFHRKADCFACVIASHGNEKPRKLEKPAKKVYFRDHCLYGSDDNTILTKAVVEKISGIEELNNKPKLFFIQACRSRPDKPTKNSIEPGYELNLKNLNVTTTSQTLQQVTSSSSGQSDSKQQESKDIEETKVWKGLLGLFQKQQDNPKEIIRILDSPCEEDCLIVYSSSSEKASFGRDGIGGWMLFSLYEAVQNQLRDATLNRMRHIELFSVLTELNYIMTKKFETNFKTGEKRKAVAVLEHRMLSEIWF